MMAAGDQGRIDGQIDARPDARPNARTGGRAAARAIDALRRGWPIAITDETGTLTLLAIEGADAVTLPAFDPDASAGILISATRAETLKLTNQRAAATAENAVLIARAPWIDLDVASAIADPVRDLSSPLKGPFRAAPLAAPAAAATALRLARLAGILPAFFVRDGDADDDGAEVMVSPGDVDAFDDPAALVIATRARLPVAAAHVAEIIAFRTPHDSREHVALVVGTRGSGVPLVRVHSECLTGDVFGSLKCDCGPQLNAALARMAHGDDGHHHDEQGDRHPAADASWGILLYLRQEGRGIGLINKLRAYALQDQGFDTVDANTRLGFAVDARDFAIAARMLELLGVSAVRLLTNNPQKVARLAAAGVTVIERLPLVAGVNPENEAYLRTKRERTGHQL